MSGKKLKTSKNKRPLPKSDSSSSDESAKRKVTRGKPPIKKVKATVRPTRKSLAQSKGDAESSSDDSGSSKRILTRKPLQRTMTAKTPRRVTTSQDGSDDEAPVVKQTPAKRGRSASTGSATKKPPAKKKKAEKYPYNRKILAPSKRTKAKHTQYFLTLEQTTKTAINTRLDRLTNETEPADATAWEKTLRGIYKVGHDAENNPAYPKGKGKGNVTSLQILGVDIDVRADKTDNGIWLRVSQKDSDDKDTQALSNLIDQYAAKQNVLPSFLSGVRGEAFALDPDQNPEKWQAFKNGVEARAVGMLSDFVDFPGNTVIAEKLLNDVDSVQKYKHLFTGVRIGNEQSYGALPSQNQTTALENDSERTGAYNAAGKLFSTGQVMISETDAGTTNGRKMISMLKAMPNVFTVQKRAANTTTDAPMATATFERLVSQKAIRRRSQSQGEALYRGVTALSDDEGSDEEREKQGKLEQDQQAQRLDRLKRAAETSVNKFGALKRTDKRKLPQTPLEDLVLMTSSRKLTALSLEEQAQLRTLLLKANGVVPQPQVQKPTGKKLISTDPNIK